MSEMWKWKVTEKQGSRVVLEVNQVHPDAGDWEVFLEDGPFHDGVTEPAFDGDSQPSCPFGKAIGYRGFANDHTPGWEDKYFSRKTSIVREAYNDDNRRERLTEAGLPSDADLTAEVVEKICGRLSIELEAVDPQWVSHFKTGMTWAS